MDTRSKTLLAWWRWILIIVGLTACIPSLQREHTIGPTDSQKTPMPISSVQVEIQDWQNRWLNGQACKPPCWERIIPGVTTPDEVVALLKEMPFVSHPTIEKYVSELRPEDGHITWEWNAALHGGGMSFDARSPNAVINDIRLIFSRPLTLKDVVFAYGEPSHVLTTAGYGPDVGSEPSYRVFILFSSYGFWLNAEHVDIEPDAAIISVNLLPVEKIMENFAHMILSHPDWLIPWQGYQKFEYYCRDEYQGKACRGER